MKGHYIVGMSTTASGLRPSALPYIQNEKNNECDLALLQQIWNLQYLFDLIELLCPDIVSECITHLCGSEMAGGPGQGIVFLRVTFTSLCFNKVLRVPSFSLSYVLLLLRMNPQSVIGMLCGFSLRKLFFFKIFGIYNFQNGPKKNP